MLIVVSILCFAIVPISYGGPVDKIESKTNSTTPQSNKKIQTKDTKIRVASEGGAIMSNAPILSLFNENQSFLMTSTADTSSNKVKARKGAFPEGSKNISTERNPIINVNQHGNDDLSANVTVNNDNVINSNLSSRQPTVVLKPSILSEELIAKSDLLNNDPAVDDGEERKIRIHKTSTTGHPGMITPIVITVLVVPIFAMIGFMALKRGQEAWKNRHYKRMDFLLDGMYNE